MKYFYKLNYVKRGKK